jgi:hypothetical protein
MCTCDENTHPSTGSVLGNYSGRWKGMPSQAVENPPSPLALSALLIGITGDALLVQLNLLEFPPYPNLAGTPLWMVSLWVCFGIMLRPVFEWFLDHCMRSIIGLFPRGCDCLLVRATIGRT